MKWLNQMAFVLNWRSAELWCMWQQCISSVHVEKFCIPPLLNHPDVIMNMFLKLNCHSPLYDGINVYGASVSLGIDEIKSSRIMRKMHLQSALLPIAPKTCMLSIKLQCSPVYLCILYSKYWASTRKCRVEAITMCIER